MPLTPFHLPYVWTLYSIRPKKFDFLALSLSAIASDFDVIFFFLFGWWPPRTLLHSLLGIYIICVPACSFASQFLSERLGGFDHWTNIDWSKKNIISSLVSSLIGATLHMILDLMTHYDTPLLYPFALSPQFNFLLFDSLYWSSAVIYLLSVVLAIYSTPKLLVSQTYKL